MKNIKLTYVPTGEHRAPQAGEWFRGISGVMVQARFNFNVQEFDIYEEVAEEIPPEEIALAKKETPV